MKNREIVRARESAKINEAFYKPSANPIRFLKGIAIAVLYGSAPMSHSYVSKKRKW